jgi:sulfoxide reductase heme-binding subunit YedZ
MASPTHTLRIITLTVCPLPLLFLVVDIAFDNLGANAIQAMSIRLGDWALRFLWLTLAITPIQTLTQWRGMAGYRQLFGLYAAFYASLHVLNYLWVDQDFQWRIIRIDIAESVYIWFGVVAYAILFTLAATSSKAAKKRLGKHWKKLHRLIYLAAVAAMAHYFWQLKGELPEPLFYTIMLVLMLSFRALVWLKHHPLSKLMLPRAARIPTPPPVAITIHRGNSLPPD